MKVRRRLSAVVIVILLLSSALLLSGCTSSDQEDVVGIPKGEEARGDFYKEENRANISVPILNTYDEPKEIVMKFVVITAEYNRYSELKKIRLPEKSQQEYYQEIHVPENETNEFIAEIIVAEDEVGIVEVEGEQLDGEALVNTTIANTNFDSKDVTVNFEVITKEGKSSERKQLTLLENSMDEYSQKISIDGTPEEYNAEIIG